MILYLDTSAIVKLYVAEEGGDIVRSAESESTRVFTSIVAYAETRSALARARQARNLTNAQHYRAVSAFEEDWTTFERVDVIETLSRRAGELADKHVLRGFDAIHLASALRAVEESGSLKFLAFDVRLIEAAEKEGFARYPVSYTT